VIFLLICDCVEHMQFYNNIAEMKFSVVHIYNTVDAHELQYCNSQYAILHPPIMKVAKSYNPSAIVV